MSLRSWRPKKQTKNDKMLQRIGQVVRKPNKAVADQTPFSSATAISDVLNHDLLKIASMHQPKASHARKAFEYFE